ncbi:hypothetical protein PQX77_008699 [Marasmius sp. AFHP31]|nr:hypothetical protein PQX77_008699 [Marasmius sp. AFHP31]
MALQSRKTRAEAPGRLLLDSLPSDITVSQTVTATWSRDKNTGTFNFELVYYDQNSRPTSTHTFTPTTSATSSSDDVTVRYGEVTFMAAATGVVELVAAFETKSVDQTPTFKPFATMNARSNPNTDPTPVTTESDTGPLASSPDQTSSFGAGEHIQMTPKGKINNGIIIGAVIGGIAFLVSVAVVILLLRRRCRRRERIDHPEAFHRDLMVVKTVTTETSASSIAASSWSWKKRREIRRLGTKGSRDSYAGSVNSTTPLRETPEDDRSSVTSGSSLYTRSSAGISSTSASFSDAASVITAQSLTPVSARPPPSPAHVQSPSRARTDRQMQIEEKIIELQGRLIGTSGPGPEQSQMRAELEQRIEKVKDLRESEWAYGGEGEVPDLLTD